MGSEGRALTAAELSLKDGEASSNGEGSAKEGVLSATKQPHSNAAINSVKVSTNNLMVTPRRLS